MKNSNFSRSFDASMALDESSDDEQADKSRRLQTYSIEALRCGIAVDKILVQHTDFKHSVKVLDRLFQIGLEFEVPQGIRLIGPPGSGKTAVFRYFLATLPGSTLYTHGAGAIGIRLQKNPIAGRMVAGLFSAIKYPFASGSAKRLFDKRSLLFEAIKAKGTRLIWVDEAQHLMRERQLREDIAHETDAAELLRELMDETHASVVLAGSEDLEKLDSLVPPLASRIAGREYMREIAEGPTWTGFLNAFSDAVTSFDLCYIKQPVIDKRLYLATSGNMRSFKRLMVEAVLIAVDSHSLVLNSEILFKAYSVTAGLGAQRSNPFG
jgi:hypothetical protein